MKWRLEQCFSRLRFATPCQVWKGVLWSTLCLARLWRVKHTKVWSAPSVHEAALRAMKRSFFRLHVFLPWRGKKMGCKFLYLVLTRENSNLFSANRNNCKTFPLRLFTWIEVLLILFMLCITITLCLRLPVEKNKNFYWQYYVNMLYYNGQRNNLWRGDAMFQWFSVALLALPFTVSISGERNAIQRKNNNEKKRIRERLLE